MNSQTTIKKIVFIPGKNPKPPATEHRRLLWRCLLRGVEQAAPQVAKELARAADCFELIYWNHLYYGCYKHVQEDLPWIEALCHKSGPSPEDLRDLSAWRRKLARLLYNIVDRYPTLINVVPDPAIRATAKETERYFRNLDGIATRVRDLLKQSLRSSFAARHKVLLIGHSMGSVIAYDSLWELSTLEHNPGHVSCFLSLGSPLGMHYAQKRLLGYDCLGAERFPSNIEHWLNIAAEGDLTALDTSLADDFAPMRDLGLVQNIEDKHQGVLNYFRNEKGLNVHRSYGYLVNKLVGQAIAQWWTEE